MQDQGFLNKDMKKMLFKLRVLRTISKKKIYSYAIIKQFQESPHAKRLFGNNKSAIKNEVYNTINALEKSNYIKISAKSKSVRIKNYYKITTKGQSALKSTKKVFVLSMKEISNILK